MLRQGIRPGAGRRKIVAGLPERRDDLIGQRILMNVNGIKFRVDLFGLIAGAGAVQEERPGTVIGSAVGDEPPFDDFTLVVLKRV